MRPYRVKCDGFCGEQSKHLVDISGRLDYKMAELSSLVFLLLLVPATKGGHSGSPLATAALPLAWLRVEEPSQTDHNSASLQPYTLDQSEQFPSGVDTSHDSSRGVDSDMVQNISVAAAESFISGGYESYYMGTFTYSVTLQAFYEQDEHFYHVCGGALISENKVLTAAHCLLDSIKYYRVGVGWKSLADYNGRMAQTINVIHIALHPQYDITNPSGTSQRSDLAVLTLERNVTRFSRYVPQILSPDHWWNQSFTWWRCELSGWGKPSVGATTISAQLKHGRVAVLKNSDCRKYFSGSDEQIYPSNLCTLNYPDMISGCEGDGGAPLVCNGNLAGILSWGLVACNGCTPDVFTRVSHHLDWIEEQIKCAYSEKSSADEQKPIT